MPDDPIVIVPYDPAWPEAFRAIRRELRAALGSVALRIDHIASTAVEALAAKPVIDVQVSVATLHPPEPFLGPLTALGYVWVRDNPDLSKRFFREPPGRARTHVHVRAAGSFAEQSALLFRDYLRSNRSAADAYGRVKERLAGQFRHDREAYGRAKDPQVWQILREAADWAQRVGWAPGPSDT